jgi:hypothetical protein
MWKSINLYKCTSTGTYTQVNTGRTNTAIVHSNPAHNHNPALPAATK